MNEVYIDLIETCFSNPVLRFEGGVSKEQLQLLLRRYNLDSNPEIEEYFGVANGGIVGPGVLLGINREDEFLNIESCKDIDDFILGSPILPIATDGCGNLYVVVLDRNDSRYGSVYFVDLHKHPLDLSYVVASSIERFVYFILKFDNASGRFGWPYDKDYMMANDSLLFSECCQHVFIWE